MKSLTRTMTILVVLNLAMGGFTFAQDAPGKKTPTYTISGSVGLPGVVMRGLPGDPISDQKGRYSVTVERDWKGTVEPQKEGYIFEPKGRIYETLVADHTNDNYTARAITYTISGRVGLAGVLMKGLPNDPISDNEGIYSTRVPYGWTGEVVPTKEGYTFMPRRRSYMNVAAGLTLTNQDFVPTGVNQRYNAQLDELQKNYMSSLGRSGRSTAHSAFGPVSSRKVLVVPAEEVKPEELAAITEDMQVMSYILDERFKETRRIQGVFIDFGDFFGRDNRQTEATYIQGYGVLFAMEVNFSFSPPPKQQAQETEQPGEQVDSTWQRARQQVFSPGEARGAEGAGSPEEYNSQMVEELKRDLITTLKHAANIRGLQPDEWVILTVVGGRREFGGVFGSNMPMMGGMSSMSAGSAYGAVSSGGMGGGFVGGMMGGYGSAGAGMGDMMRGTGTMGGGMMGGMGGYAMMGPSSSTVLTIRAKKSDVDAFAANMLMLGDFQQKVKIVMY